MIFRAKIHNQIKATEAKLQWGLRAFWDYRAAAHTHSRTGTAVNSQKPNNLILGKMMEIYYLLSCTGVTFF